MSGRRKHGSAGRLAGACCALGLWVAAPGGPAGAEPADVVADVVAALAAADPDPLATARVVARFGDAAVLALLEPSRPVAEQLYGLFALPWVEASALALPRLASLLRSRDSALAPAAAAAVVRVAERVDEAALARNELDRGEVCAAGRQLQEAATDEALGADVRLAAGVAAHMLEGVCPIPSGVDPD